MVAKRSPRSWHWGFPTVDPSHPRCHCWASQQWHPSLRPDTVLADNGALNSIQLIQRDSHHPAVVVEALDLQVLGQKFFAAKDLHRKLALLFQPRNLPSLLVVQIRGHRVGHGHIHLSHPFVLGADHQFAHHFQRHALGRLDVARAAAAWTIVKHTAFEAGTDSLPRHFDQAKGTGAQDLGAGAIAFDGLLERPFDAAAMFVAAHVDEVVDNHAAQIAEPQLPGDFLGRHLVKAERRFFGAAVGAKIAAVHVDSH